MKFVLSLLVATTLSFQNNLTYSTGGNLDNSGSLQAELNRLTAANLSLTSSY